MLSYIQQGGTFNDLGRLAKTEVLFGTFRYNINFDLSSSAAGDECKFELFNMLWAGGVVRQSAFTQHTTERATAGSQLMRFQLQGEHHNVLTSGFWFHCGASGFTFNDSVAHLDFVGYKISIQ